MQKRKFDELISHFNRKVSEMSIEQKYKMELLGMISAIGFAHEKELSTNLASLGTDCISRQAAIDATKKHYRAHDNDLLELIAFDIEQLPSAQPKTNYSESPNTSDCISRQQAIDALERAKQNIRHNIERAIGRAICEILDEVENGIKQLPPIQPKRGRWHYSDGKPARIGLSFGVVCDQCGTESEYCTNFCGECGADMRGEQDE